MTSHLLSITSPCGRAFFGCGDKRSIVNQTTRSGVGSSQSRPEAGTRPSGLSDKNLVQVHREKQKVAAFKSSNEIFGRR